MKAGLATSVTLHAILLGVGMISLSAPKAFEVADVESLPVDIVPFEEISQARIGEKNAPARENPAPLPTRRPETTPEAQKVGDADVDTGLPPTPAPKPKPVQKAEEPAPTPQPTPKPAEKPVEQAKVEPPKPTPVPPEPPKPAERLAPPKEPTTEAPAEAAPKETAAAENVQLPDRAPVPQSRPQPEPQKVAEKPKPAERPADAPKRTQKAETPKKDVLDEVAALLNKEQSAGGGAKRSTDQAALGSTRKNTGQKLSQNEMDSLRSQIQQCWNVPAGALDAENLKVSIKFRLTPNGEVDGRPEIIDGGGNSPIHRAAAESARRAILKCGPYNLPAEKYEAWADVIVHFDPSDMF